MWLEQADPTAIRTFVRYSDAMVLASKIDGTILWANDAFCKWSGYTLRELQKMSWKEISVHDDDLTADVDMAEALADINPYSPVYKCQKRYIPKNKTPELGTLTVMRYPATGQIEFAWCEWEPMVNGTAKAFGLLLEAKKEYGKAMTELTTQIKSLTSQSEEQRFTLSVLAMASKYPKVALATVLIILSFSGFDTLLSTLQRLGYIQQPPVVVKEVRE